MIFPDFDKAVSVPDDDARLCGAGPGMTKCTDRVLYVRESDWLNFLLLYVKASHGAEIAEQIRKAVLH